MVGGWTVCAAQASFSSDWANGRIAGAAAFPSAKLRSNWYGRVTLLIGLAIGRHERVHRERRRGCRRWLVEPEHVHDPARRKVCYALGLMHELIEIERRLQRDNEPEEVREVTEDAAPVRRLVERVRLAEQPAYRDRRQTGRDRLGPGLDTGGERDRLHTGQGVLRRFLGGLRLP